MAIDPSYKNSVSFPKRSLGIWIYMHSNMAQTRQKGKSSPKRPTLMISYLSDLGQLEPKQVCYTIWDLCVNTRTIRAQEVASSYFSTQKKHSTRKSASSNLHQNEAPMYLPSQRGDLRIYPI